MAKRSIVVPRESRIIQEGLDIGDRHISFHGKTGKMIDDPGIVEAIEQKYGLSATGIDAGRVWTHEDPRATYALNYHEGVAMGKSTHNYFFGSTRSFREGWEKIFGRKNRKTERIFGGK